VDIRFAADTGALTDVQVGRRDVRLVDALFLWSGRFCRRARCSRFDGRVRQVPVMYPTGLPAVADFRPGTARLNRFERLAFRNRDEYVVPRARGDAHIQVGRRDGGVA